jgi:release factor glutamine methyltransferase
MIGTAITVGEALADATHQLRDAGQPTPRLDAEVLLAHVIGRDRTWLLAHPEAPMEHADEYRAAVARRATGEPIAYIRGFKEWRSLRIQTDPRALIPRPETELVVEAASAEVRARGGTAVVWDVATGSGAIAVALGLEFSDALADGRLRIIASDISGEALALAAVNLVAHRLADAVELVEADLLAPAGGALPRPDVVTANLPYVSSSEVDERAGSLGFEPRVALDGGPDGLVVLRSLFAELPDRVAHGATVILELGAGQVEAVQRLAPGGTSVTVVPDLAGLDRVVRVEMPS